MVNDVGSAWLRAEKAEKTVAAVSDDSILVGTFFALTGPLAPYGQDALKGVQMALEKINAQGIHGKKIRLIVEDNKGEPVESANAVESWLMSIKYTPSLVRLPPRIPWPEHPLPKGEEFPC